MGRVYGEPIEVLTKEDGDPVSFAWRGRRYTVISVQEYWIVNRDWWREPAPFPERPELRFWRVEASAGQGQPAGSYELRRDMAAGAWMLRGIAD